MWRPETSPSEGQVDACKGRQPSQHLFQRLHGPKICISMVDTFNMKHTNAAVGKKLGGGRDMISVAPARLR